MTATQYKTARTRLGFTQQALAENLGVSKRTIQAREWGMVKISVEAEMAMKWILLNKRTKDKL